MKMTFSAVMRTLRQSKPEIVSSFLSEFQKNMFNAIEEKIENPERVALLQTMSDLKINL